MSDALIASLQQRISELTTENATIKAEAKDRRIKGKRLAEELDQLRAERDTLTADRDGIKAKLEAAPSELQGKIDELTGQIRTRDHKDAWGSVKEVEAAGADGIKKKYKLADGATIDDVWQTLGYKPEGDKPEAQAISEHLGKALQAKPFMFSEVQPETGKVAAGAATQPFSVQRREAGPGPGKSADTPAPGAPGSAAANRVPGRL